MLAGGAGRRLGGVDKPALQVDGRSLLDRALTALGGIPTVVVGPWRETARPVTFVAEDPPGAGPAAALQTGVQALPDLPADAVIVVLAADLPAVSAATVRRLSAALLADPAADGALLLDENGREQTLLAVWRRSALAAACAARPTWTGASLRSQLAPLRRIAVSAVGDEAADIDTPEQWGYWSGR